MCFHTEKDYRRWERARNQAIKEADALPAIAMLSVRDKHGQLIGAMPVEWRSRQQIANTAQDLLSWHPDTTLDFTEVNQRIKAFNNRVYRYAPERAKAEVIYVNLPKPSRPPMPNVNVGHDIQDEDLDVVRQTVKDYMAQNKASVRPQKVAVTA